MTDRGLAGPDAVRRGLVDQHHRSRPQPISRVEGPPADDRDSHRLEIVGRHDPDQQRSRRLLVVGQPASVERRHRDRVAEVGQGQAENRARGLDARKRCGLRHERIDQGGTLRRHVVRGVGQRQVERLDARGVEAEIDRRELQKTSEQQARPDQEHHGESRLGDDEQRTNPVTMAIAGRGPALLANAAGDVANRRGVPGGKRSKEQRRTQRNRDRKCHDRRIDAGFAKERNGKAAFERGNRTRSPTPRMRGRQWPRQSTARRFRRARREPA